MGIISWDHLVSMDETEKLIPPLQLLTGLPLVIMIGLTGVGKTTVLGLLSKSDLAFTLLPNRREITDKVIIAFCQREAGQPPFPVMDRVERFNYTARYRAEFSGGMAYALSRLAVNPAGVTFPLIFDGLRGLEEVQHAVAYFPQARFVVLDAPDTVRLKRLLGREDAFDTTAIHSIPDSDDLLTTLREVPDIEKVFSRDRQEEIVKMAYAACCSREELIKKISIIVEERRNYDSGAAQMYLAHTLPPARLLIVDTTIHPASAVANYVAGWLAEAEH